MSINARGPLALVAALVFTAASVMAVLQPAAAASGEVQAAILPPYCNGVSVVAPVDAKNNGSSEQTLDLFLDGEPNGSHVLPAGAEAGFAFDLSGISPGQTYTLETRSAGTVIDSSFEVLPTCSSTLTGQVTVSGCSSSTLRPLVQYRVNNDGFVPAAVTVRVDGKTLTTVNVQPDGVVQGNVETSAMPQGQAFTTSLNAGPTLVFSGAEIARDCATVSDAAVQLRRTACTTVAVNGGLPQDTVATTTLEWNQNGPRSMSFTGVGETASPTGWRHTFTNMPGFPAAPVKVKAKLSAEGVLLHSTDVDVAACVPPSQTAGPAVSGTARVGTTLVCNVRYNNATRTIVQWYRDGRAITGATASRYATTGKDYRHWISCASRGSNLAGWGALKSSNRVSLSGIGPKPKVVKAPTIKGTKKVGRTVKLSTRGKWDVSVTKVKCRWLRNGVAISKATKCSGYKLTWRDRGKRISVRVTAAPTGYTAAYGYSKRYRVS